MQQSHINKVFERINGNGIHLVKKFGEISGEKIWPDEWSGTVI
jgi:hypothetical protein